MTRERKVLKEFLETYKFLPCLWNPGDKFYLNKDARNQALEILVEKYKTIDSEANIDLIKRRLENMRCAYKREYKKVLASRALGQEEYKPSLWYYKYLLFLDERDADGSGIADQTGYSSGEEEGTPVYTGLPKKRRHSSTNDNTIYFIDKNEESKVDERDSTSNEENEAISFGKTVGLQLKRLDEMQRNIAEKLISEIIYYARLNQLTIKATVNLNEDFQS